MTGTSEILQELFDEMTPAVRAFAEGLLVLQAALERQAAEFQGAAEEDLDEFFQTAVVFASPCQARFVEQA